MPGSKSENHRELAARLGVQTSELWERPVAARAIGIAVETLRRLRDVGPGYYRQGKTCWYPRTWVEAYVLERQGQRAPKGALRSGLQPWPDTPIRLKFAEMQARVTTWRLREEWTRGHQLVTIGFRPDSRWRVDATERLINERAFCAAFEGGQMLPELHQIAERAMQCALPPEEDWTAGACGLVANELKAMVEREARWLAGDLSDLPKMPPP